MVTYYAAAGSVLFLIKLIVVDDERATREGLVDFVPWKDLGVDIVEAAEDGAKALELALEIQPDIVLSDVRMPKMDGIELAALLKEKLPECKVIFLSGYSDKEYLKSAINLKAVSYVEKPVNIEEISEVVKHTASLCISEKAQKKAECALKNKLEESISLLNLRLALELTNSHGKIGELQERLRLAKVDFPDDGDYITVLLKLNLHGSNTASEQQALVAQVLSFVEQRVSREKPTSDFLFYLIGIKDTEYIIVHLNTGISKSRRPLQLLFEDIKEGINDIFSSSNCVFIGIGKRVQGPGKILESYQAAVVALQKQFFLGYNHIVFYEEKAAGPYHFDNSITHRFVELLKENKNNDAIALIRNLMEDIRRNDNTIINSVRDIFFTLLYSLSKVAEERNVHINEHSSERKFLWEVVSRASTLDEIGDYIIERIEFINEYLKEKDSKGNMVFNIMKFVQEKYHDENLSIKTIADFTYLTHTYLCLVFKNGTGKTINQYITEYRVEKSKEVLKDKHIKLYDVAKRVGYSDANYFAKTFKKVVGMNPSEYREKYLL
jgi:two-component system, response regulator YesN